MKPHVFLPALVLGIAIFSFAGQVAGATVPVITEQKDVAKHVGEIVTIVGKVSDARIPQILGVDVASDTPDLRGKMAEATGILERYEVTEAQIREMDRARAAHRGPGVFYRLRDEKRNTEAQVRER